MLPALVLYALVPSLLINIYIVGLNQLHDVEIDRVNKPYLPLASGDLSVGAGAHCAPNLRLARAVHSHERTWLADATR